MIKRGKRICNTLKEVRMQVAKTNGIEYAPTECHHKGDCAGTCPKCEAEVRWLEQQLRLRRQLGKAVAVVGVSMGLAALTACNHNRFTDRTAGEIDFVPDTLSEVNPVADPYAIDPDTVSDTLSVTNRVAEPNGTDQNDEQGIPSAVRQAVEPIYLDAVAGEVLPSPSFPGGQSALIDFLNENKKYPEQAKKDSIEGRVVVSFTVESDGSISNPKIERSVHPLLDAEALRLVRLMPKWEPGAQSRYNIPISFKMN